MSTKELQERIKCHKRNYKYTNYAFHRALLKYGFENFSFDVIDTANSLNDLIIKEYKYIQKYDSMNPCIGYNMIAQDDHMKIFNEETKEKISKSQIKRMKNLTKESKQIIYERSSRTRQGERRNKNKKYVGVFKSKHADSYSTEISFKTMSNQRYRKVFSNEKNAAKAYDKIALYLYGEKAALNFQESKDEYYKEDLESFVDWFLHCHHKVGRRSIRAYSFVTLLQDAKKTAKQFLYRKLNGKNITSDIVDSLLEIKFHWDGIPYNFFIT
jgi:hypothetical protein